MTRKEEREQEAMQHGNLSPVIHYDADGNTYCDYAKPAIDYIAGAEWADRTMIEKAWNWIEDNLLSSNQQDKSYLYFEQFKKYMEGE